MSFSIPLLSDLVRRARLGFRSELKGSDAAIWPNNVYVTGKVIGGALSALFQRLDIVRRDIHAHTAGLDGVLRHATEFGLSRKPASPASGSATIVSSGASAIARGAILIRSDGIEYRVAASFATLGAETFSVAIEAAVAGAAGNCEADAVLEPGDGVSGAIESATVAEPGIRGGADPEDIGTSLRERVLFRKRNPIHGGAPADYKIWASDVPGVTRVFVARRPLGRGTVAVYPIMDDDREDGIPLEADIARIADYIALQAPADAEILTVAATAFPIDVTVDALQPSNAVVKTAIRVEIADMLARRGRVSGTDPGHPALPFLTTPLTMSRSWFEEAISSAEGEDSHVLIAPAADIAVPSGRIPVLGNLIFT